jgi:hypothetical protein
VCLVAYTGKKSNVYRILAKKHKGENHSEDPGIDGRIILEWILKK